MGLVLFSLQTAIIFLKQHLPADLFNCEVWCSLWGTDWIIKYYLTSFDFKGLNLNSVNQLIFVMVKVGVLFEVRTGFFNNI
jgi:hypothetical protein